jgi:hypothetical protein
VALRRKLMQCLQLPFAGCAEALSLAVGPACKPYNKKLLSRIRFSAARKVI